MPQEATDERVVASAAETGPGRGPGQARPGRPPRAPARRLGRPHLRRGGRGPRDPRRHRAVAAATGRGPAVRRSLDHDPTLRTDRPTVPRGHRHGRDDHAPRVPSRGPRLGPGRAVAASGPRCRTPTRAGRTAGARSLRSPSAPRRPSPPSRPRSCSRRRATRTVRGRGPRPGRPRPGRRARSSGPGSAPVDLPAVRCSCDAATGEAGHAPRDARGRGSTATLFADPAARRSAPGPGTSRSGRWARREQWYDVARRTPRAARRRDLTYLRDDPLVRVPQGAIAGRPRLRRGHPGAHGADLRAAGQPRPAVPGPRHHPGRRRRRARRPRPRRPTGAVHHLHRRHCRSAGPATAGSCCSTRRPTTSLGLRGTAGSDIDLGDVGHPPGRRSGSSTRSSTTGSSTDAGDTA